MKRLVGVIVLLAVLGGCAVVPVGEPPYPVPVYGYVAPGFYYGYRPWGYRWQHGGYYGYGRFHGHGGYHR